MPRPVETGPGRVGLPTVTLHDPNTSGADRSPASLPAPAAGGPAGSRAFAGATPSVEAAVRGLGYDLVDVERAPGGLLRITIDNPWVPGEDPLSHRAINVDDCEKVTRQLQHVLEVEGTNYQRLEVSSPGLDRPLRHHGDFERHLGLQVELTLKAPFQGRKRWKGELQRGEADGWRLVLAPDVPTVVPRGRAHRAGAKAGKAPGAAKAWPATAPQAGTADADTVLDFALAEVREARLVPVVDFKGLKGRRAPADAGHEPAGDTHGADGGREE